MTIIRKSDDCTKERRRYRKASISVWCMQDRKEQSKIERGKGKTMKRRTRVPARGPCLEGESFMTWILHLFALDLCYLQHDRDQIAHIFELFRSGHRWRNERMSFSRLESRARGSQRVKSSLHGHANIASAKGLTSAEGNPLYLFDWHQFLGGAMFR